MLVWDNQQEISWLSGILEGEGFASKSEKRIQITNTNIEIVNNCIRILSKNLIYSNLQEQTHRNPNLKKVYNIIISGGSECYTLLKTLRLQCRIKEFYEKLQLRSSETTRDTPLTPDLHWLIGIYEAEGWISLESDRNDRYNPVVGMKNTNEKIVEKVAITLKDLGLSWNVDVHKADNPNHKKIFTVRIRGMKRCQRFLAKTKNLWTTSHHQNRATLVSEFCSTRLQSEMKGPYTNAQHAIYLKLKTMI